MKSKVFCKLKKSSIPKGIDEKIDFWSRNQCKNGKKLKKKKFQNQKLAKNSQKKMRWKAEIRNFKELGRKLRFTAKIGQEMSQIRAKMAKNYRKKKKKKIANIVAKFC